MARFEDSPELFGAGVGSSTCGNITCQWCGTDYSGREDADGEASMSNDSIGFTRFGDFQICDCCFEQVEDAVLSRIHDIIPWFIRILQSDKQRLQNQENMLEELKRHLLTH